MGVNDEKWNGSMCGIESAGAEVKRSPPGARRPRSPRNALTCYGHPIKTKGRLHYKINTLPEKTELRAEVHATNRVI